METIYDAILYGLKSSLIIGLFYGIGTIGLSLIYRYLKFPDFSTVVSIIVGGLICVQVTNSLNNSFGIVLGIIAGAFIGALIGLITGLQIVYAKIPPILAGIITFTSTKSLAFFISNNNAVLPFNNEIRGQLDYIVNNIFTFQSLITCLILCVLLSYLLSRVFRTRFGLMILALLGTENYIKYRHKEKGKTTILVIMLGNAIIGFSGALASIQNNDADVTGHNEFIYIALGGFALGSYFIKMFSNRKVQDYLKKDDKTTAPISMRVVNFFIGSLNYNDEHPSKVFATFILFIFSSAIINVVFKTVENEVGESYSYFLKAVILFILIGISNISEKISKKN